VRGRLALCLVVLLAGCSGFGGTGAEPTDTMTPAPVPAESEGETYPPGIGPEGVTDPLLLGESHYGAIDGESYTTRRNRTVRAPNGSLLVRTDLHAEFSADRSQFLVDYTVTGPDPSAFGTDPGRLVLWTDGEVLLRSVTADGTTTRQQFPAEVFSQRPGPFGESPGDAFGLTSPDREVYWLFTAFETTARPATGSRSVRVTGTLAEPAALRTVDGVSDPRNGTLRAVVAPNGLVRTYHLSYEATVDGHTVHVERSVRHAAVGSTTIERPSWYGAVVNGTEE